MINIEQIIGNINNSIINDFDNKYLILNNLTFNVGAHLYTVYSKTNKKQMIMKINTKKTNFNLIKRELLIYKRLQGIIPNNICKIYDSYLLEHEKIGFFIMEKINCENAAYNIDIKQLICLLKKLHDNFTYHLDLHTGNIGYDDNNNIILIDFNCSKTLEKEKMIYKITDLLLFTCIYTNHAAFGLHLRDFIVIDCYYKKLLNDDKTADIIYIIKEKINNSHINIKEKLFYILSNYNDANVYKYLADDLEVPSDFHSEAYRILNKDLVKNFESDHLLKNHYLIHGKKENRKYKFTNLPDDFNVENYKKLNPDLQHLTDDEAVCHYEKHGFYEKRKCY